MMKKSDYTLISDVSKEFFDAVCCYSFKALASFTNFEGCFDVFDSYMDIEDYFNTFVNSEYKDDIASYVTELLEEKSSLQEIIELIKNTIDNAATLFYKPEPVIPQKPIVTVGGGGGGGSASNKVVISEDIIKEEIQDRKVEEIIKDVFTDVDSEHWAKDSIAILYAKGIISGRTKDSFAPEANVTRAEFVKLVSEALDLTDNNAECDFNDVSPDDWSYKYIASLKNNGFINGISESEFGASNSITRQDAATIIYNCIKNILDKTGNGTKFSDAQSISEYATEAVGKLYKIGVISGFPDGSFAPTQNITRAQSAQIIYNLLNYKGGI